MKCYHQQQTPLFSFSIYNNVTLTTGLLAILVSQTLTFPSLPPLTLKHHSTPVSVEYLKAHEFSRIFESSVQYLKVSVRYLKTHEFSWIFESSVEYLKVSVRYLKTYEFSRTKTTSSRPVNAVDHLLKEVDHLL